MLKEIDRDIWVAEQPFRYLGFGIGTRMTVVRLANRELVVISPIQASETIVSQLRELGTVKHIIAPNLYHYLFTARFKESYPDATLWAVPGLADKKPDLPIDQVIESDINNPWDGIEHVFFEGFKTIGLTGFDSLNECVFFHPMSRTLILTDTAFHFDESFPVITQLATRVIGGYKSLSPSLLERVATLEKGKVRGAVEKVLSWDFNRVIMAHGSIIEEVGKEKFKQGYEQFLGQAVNAAT
ncbi:DUF4336 domain-containing protein [Pseudanabaena sp. FACHB-2040]|uniref:DUF4336 domain-containing protein n=1 Tax=Pseudanabaena sp. FACHB-2040 TaxID=2692859 RepID=UPI0016836E10|nr:DUF4336 domain-containing protein [Pseudanabaena sp. FACHB-2040]MBD2256066.1 DUF4336 domain-containing protein [Pseudanabaena sp. FACHB-2040]